MHGSRGTLDFNKQKLMKVSGDNALASYKAKNLINKPIFGISITWYCHLKLDSN